MADHHSLNWRGETPVSTRFDDPYFSLENGLDETRHVFLQGNGLPDRFCDGFQIAELGFGTGLNLLAALQLWRQTGITGKLRFTTFEAFPLSAPDMTRAQAAFDDVAEIASELAPHWGKNTFEIADLRFEMVEGDARETLPQWQGKADAWFLDGFSPAKNPELWSPELMAEVGAHMAPGASAATYTAAGHVRRGLVAAGLEVTRIPGYGRKRHMTRAIKPT
ncbi:tRNA (5-methylaminomethyl-2-thiouridine)(34)-methyltransferase MnmD [uncultured Pelagimonas sp.]|uniref:tRNA (5-methylaminomethyl-2-thiouridine)(34)-methyltransferase MnmD n=1 Tax=uncultured Pelagimonas sp. TaxID=1618102 RepID=UPI00260C9865|nr:tRNA (5-methylaminomethyl-2-thiouridine)(34)-methyltransferase MnmD [uncultured Pelagimonas sp.]